MAVHSYHEHLACLVGCRPNTFKLRAWRDGRPTERHDPDLGAKKDEREGVWIVLRGSMRGLLVIPVRVDAGVHLLACFALLARTCVAPPQCVLAPPGLLSWLPALQLTAVPS